MAPSPVYFYNSRFVVLPVLLKSGAGERQIYRDLPVQSRDREDITVGTATPKLPALSASAKQPRSHDDRNPRTNAAAQPWQPVPHRDAFHAGLVERGHGRDASPKPWAPAYRSRAVAAIRSKIVYRSALRGTAGQKASSRILPHTDSAVDRRRNRGRCGRRAHAGLINRPVARKPRQNLRLRGSSVWG